MTLRPSLSSATSFLRLRGRLAGVLAAGLIVLLLSEGAFAAKPAKWEYLVVSANLTSRRLEALLNSNGANGWELVQISEQGVAVFKRLKLK